MLDNTAATRGLDQALHSPHSHDTRGQSHGGGLVTSHWRRRSRSLGRVVASCPGASALKARRPWSPRVTNTRLCPVPLLNREARLSWGQQHSFIDHRLQIASCAERSPAEGGQP